MDEHAAHHLTEAIRGLTMAIREFAENETKSVLHRIDANITKLMSQISDYAKRVDAYFNSISESVDGLVASVAGVSGDVANLKDIILKLQTNPGPISAEDQALLDAGEAKVTALATKTAEVSAAMKALDAATETAPPAPPAPPV